MSQGKARSRSIRLPGPGFGFRNRRLTLDFGFTDGGVSWHHRFGCPSWPSPLRMLAQWAAMTAQAWIRECSCRMKAFQDESSEGGFAMLRTPLIAAMGAFTGIALLALAMEWVCQQAARASDPGELAGAGSLTQREPA